MANEIAIKEQSLDAIAVNLDAKLKVCDMIAKSGLAPASFKTPQAIFTAMLRGGELGFSPMQSLETFDVVQGRVTMRAAGLQALCVANGGKFEVLEESDKACTIRASRASNGWQQEYTFSMDDAAKMQLNGKENWKKMPKFMLYARCVSVLCRRGWADKVAGLYSSEEMRDSVEQAPVITYEVADRTAAETKAAIAEIDKQEALADARYVYDGAKIAIDYPKKAERKKEWERIQRLHPGVFVDDKTIFSPTDIKEWKKYLIDGPKEEEEGVLDWKSLLDSFLQPDGEAE
jgi:hypothetical protein